MDKHPEEKAHGEAETAQGRALEELFHDTLKDIYYAERKILKALPKMAEAAQSSDLKAAFEQHISQTEGQLDRLHKVFQMIGKPAEGKKCEAIKGIIEEGEEILEHYEDTAAIDAGLISSAQAVEHYEITRYGTLKRWAEALGMKDAAGLLDETLHEEKDTDLHLSEIADRMAPPGSGQHAAH